MGLQYSLFCEQNLTWVDKVDGVMRQQYRVSQELFVDYTERTVPVIECHRAEIRQAQIFVAAPRISSETFTKATWSQSLSN